MKKTTNIHHSFKKLLIQNVDEHEEEVELPYINVVYNDFGTQFDSVLKC